MGPYRRVSSDLVTHLLLMMLQGILVQKEKKKNLLLKILVTLGVESVGTDNKLTTILIKLENTE